MFSISFHFILNILIIKELYKLIIKYILRLIYWYHTFVLIKYNLAFDWLKFIKHIPIKQGSTVLNISLFDTLGSQCLLEA